MKLNLKKIGAIVAGATILASSVAFAGVMYGNTVLVNDNGQPLAKVIVGEKAAASDAVGAAKIVEKLANNAYATKKLKASATATCTAGAGTGTCEVSQETVTLEITVPGLGTGVHDFGLWIADYLDKDTKERFRSDAEKWDELNDLLDDDANMYQNQNGSYLITDVSEPEWYYWINGDNFVPFSKITVQAGAGRASNWDEHQFAWFHGNTPRDDDDVDVDLDGSGYSLVFGPTEYGLPLCPGEEEKAYYNSNDNCKGTSDSIEAYRMQIKFLGENWIISGVDIPNNNESISATDDQTVYEIRGTKVTLAKEATYGIIDVGECLTWEQKGVKVCLDDISTLENIKPAIVSFTDLQGNLITDSQGNPVKDQIRPGQTKKIYVPGYGDIKVHVYQTAPGYGLLAKWAEMAIYADEIELEDGKPFTGADGKESELFTVVIGLTNKDGGKKGQADHLKEIMLYDSSGPDEPLNYGDSYTITDLPGYAAYELRYLGLENLEKDTLKFQTTGSSEQTLTVYNPSSPDTPIHLSFNGTKVTTSKSRFKLSPYKGTTFWVVMNSNSSNPAIDKGDILFKDEDDNKWWWKDNSNVLPVHYDWAGDEGYVDVYKNGHIVFVENVDKYRDKEIVDGMGVFMNYSGANLYLYGADDDEVTFYTGETSGASDLLNNATVPFDQLGYANKANYSTGKFISLRGTVVTGEKEERKFLVPRDVTEVQLRFQPKVQGEVKPDTVTCTQPEGGTCNVRDVSILVKSIDEVVAPCSVSGGACAVESVDAQIVDENGQAMGAEVPASVPYTLTSHLMYLDTEATGLGTGVVITVGGQVVNSVTAAALEEAGITIDETNNVVVKEVGNKIIVAGYTAEDTLTAVDQFLAGITRQ